jgi:predicted nucleic acid-binding protein
LEDYLRKNKIKVIKPGKPLSVKGLHRGEAGTIALALELGVTEVLIDEDDARVIAKVYGLNPRGTLFILIESVRKKIISEDEAVEILDEMPANEKDSRRSGKKL